MAAGALRLSFMVGGEDSAAKSGIVKPDVGRCSVRAREERESTPRMLETSRPMPRHRMGVLDVRKPRRSLCPKRILRLECRT